MTKGILHIIGLYCSMEMISDMTEKTPYANAV